MQLDRDDLRQSLRKGRYYVWPPGSPDAEQFIGVTTAISNGVPKPALMYWAAKMVATAAVERYGLLGQMIDEDGEQGAIDWLKASHRRMTNKAADIGSEVHNIAEAHLTMNPAEVEDMIDEVTDPMARRKLAQVVAFFDYTKPKVIAVEAVVFNRTHRYAGTLDFILDIDHPEILKRFGTTDSIRLMVDLKTGKGVYAEAALQLSAYANAEFMASLDVEEMTVPKVDGGAVLHVTESSWGLIPVDIGEDAFAMFLAALEMARHMDETSDSLIGRAVVRGRA